MRAKYVLEKYAQNYQASIFTKFSFALNQSLNVWFIAVNWLQWAELMLDVIIIYLF